MARYTHLYGKICFAENICFANSAFCIALILLCCLCHFNDHSKQSDNLRVASSEQNLKQQKADGSRPTCTGPLCLSQSALHNRIAHNWSIPTIYFLDPLSLLASEQINDSSTLTHICKTKHCPVTFLHSNYSSYWGTGLNRVYHMNSIAAQQQIWYLILMVQLL